MDSFKNLEADAVSAVTAKDWSIAAELYKELIKQSPWNPSYWKRLGDCECELARWSDALEHYELAYRMAPSAEIKLAFAAALNKLTPFERHRRAEAAKGQKSERQKQLQHEVERAEELRLTREAIQAFCTVRGIKRLFHFTRLENLPSILQYGLVPVAALQRLGIASERNDSDRYDGHPDMISVSIGWPNYQMLYSYQNRVQGSRWAILELPASLLWQSSCFFYWHNAASSELSVLRPEALQTVDALKDLYSETITIRGRAHERPPIPVDFPTSPQAEVMIREQVATIDLTVHVERKADLGNLQIPRASISSNFFRPRIDYKSWQKDQEGEQRQLIG